MSDGTWKLVFDPFSGTFEQRRVPILIDGSTGGAVTNGTLVLPNGVELELAGGMAVVNGSTITLDPGATILVLP